MGIVLAPGLIALDRLTLGLCNHWLPISLAPEWKIYPWAPESGAILYKAVIYRLRTQNNGPYFKPHPNKGGTDKAPNLGAHTSEAMTEAEAVRPNESVLHSPAAAPHSLRLPLRLTECIPGKPVAYKSGLVSMNYVSIWGMAAHHFGRLSFPGKPS